MYVSATALETRACLKQVTSWLHDFWIASLYRREQKKNAIIENFYNNNQEILNLSVYERKTAGDDCLWPWTKLTSSNWNIGTIVWYGSIRIFYNYF